jgi:hypothetical protein
VKWLIAGTLRLSIKMFFVADKKRVVGCCECSSMSEVSALLMLSGAHLFKYLPIYKSHFTWYLIDSSDCVSFLYCSGPTDRIISK